MWYSMNINKNKLCGCYCFQEQFSLEQICGGMSVFPTNERCINMLVNFIMPLCIRVGCGRRGRLDGML